MGCGPTGGSCLTEFEIKDSGVREEYESGMRRDTQDGKPDYTLIDLPMLRRWADHMTKGAKKYGRRNWQLAKSEEELGRFQASAFRHLIAWLMGEVDEDHASAVFFNIAAAEYVKAKRPRPDLPKLRHEEDESPLSHEPPWRIVRPITGGMGRRPPSSETLRKIA